MNPNQLKGRMKSDPSFFANVVIQNNPNAVAEKALQLGLATKYLDEDQLVFLADALIKQNQLGSLVKMLNVPYLTTASNETAKYIAAIFTTIPQQKKAYSEDDDYNEDDFKQDQVLGNNRNANPDLWGNILKGIGAFADGFGTSLISGESKGPGTGANQPPATPPAPNPKEKNNIIIWVAVGVFVLIVSIAVTLAVAKSTKK